MVCVRTRSTRTLEPFRVPSHTHPEALELMFSSVSESVHDFGSSSFMLHILPISCKDSWKARSARSEMPTRTYIISESRMGGGGLDAHAVQILDEPCQIVTLQGWKNVLILVSAKEANELLVKPR